MSQRYSHYEVYQRVFENSLYEELFKLTFSIAFSNGNKSGSYSAKRNLLAFSKGKQKQGDIPRKEVELLFIKKIKSGCHSVLLLVKENQNQVHILKNGIELLLVKENKNKVKISINEIELCL